MIEVIGVSFKENGRIYYFAPNNYELKKDEYVIVETEKGIQFGKIETNIIEIEKEKIKNNLKSITRIATQKDIEINNKNSIDAKKALQKCKDLVNKNELNMKIIDAQYTFDRDQLIFHFIADNRVDFRTLAKDLASIYKTRIELRQIGVRDKAREVGGLGLCGRKSCCSKYLTDFDTVTIGMAKNQNLSLNPTKINGICGRLLCCLKYEDSQYSDCRNCLPEIGKKVETEKGTGTVTSLNILEKKYTVFIPDVGNIEIDGCKNEN